MFLYLKFLMIKAEVSAETNNKLLKNLIIYYRYWSKIIYVGRSDYTDTWLLNANRVYSL